MKPEGRSLQSIMRVLHRDIGFLLIGLTIIYCASGILLIYRDTDFLKSDRLVQKQLEPNLEARDLGRYLRMRDFKVINSEGDIIHFQGGDYNKNTGLVNQTIRSIPPFLEKAVSLHKRSSRASAHIFSTIYGVLLLFLAVSSFWMYKPNTKMFKRGIIIAAVGAGLSIVLLIF